MASLSRRTLPPALAALTCLSLALALTPCAARADPDPGPVHVHALAPRTLVQDQALYFLTHVEGQPYAGIERIELYSTLGDGPAPPRPAPGAPPLHRVHRTPVCSVAPHDPCGTPAEVSACTAAGGTCPDVRNRYFKPDSWVNRLPLGTQYLCIVIYQRGYAPSQCAFYNGGGEPGRLTPDYAYPIVVSRPPIVPVGMPRGDMPGPPDEIDDLIPCLRPSHICECLPDLCELPTPLPFPRNTFLFRHSSALAHESHECLLGSRDPGASGPCPFVASGSVHEEPLEQSRFDAELMVDWAHGSTQQDGRVCGEVSGRLMFRASDPQSHGEENHIVFDTRFASVCTTASPDEGAFEFSGLVQLDAGHSTGPFQNTAAYGVLSGTADVEGNLSFGVHGSPGELPRLALVARTVFRESVCRGDESLEPVTITLDNRASAVDAVYQIEIDDPELPRNAWARADPPEGVVRAGETAVVTLVPREDLCADVAASQETANLNARVLYASGEDGRTPEPGSADWIRQTAVTYSLSPAR